MNTKKFMKAFYFMLLCCILVNANSNISYGKEDEIIIILPEEPEETNPGNNTSQPYVPIIQTPTPEPTPVQQKPKKPVSKTNTSTPTPTPEPTQTPTPEPTAEPTTKEEPLNLAEPESLEKIPNYLLDSKWSSDNNTLTREIEIIEGTTRLEVFYSKEGPAPVLKFKDTEKNSLNVVDIATIQAENQVEGYEDILYDIIYISNPQNHGTWKMTITKTDDLKELIIVNSNVPNGWENDTVGIFKTKVKKVECWYLSTTSKYKATDIENIIEEEETKINYSTTVIPEEVIEEPEINYGRVVILLVGVIVIGVVGVFVHKSYKEKLADRLEREEGARRRGQKTTYTEEEDYARLNAELDLQDDEYSDDDYIDNNYADNSYSNDDYMDEDYSDDDYTDDDYADDDYADDSYQNNTYVAGGSLENEYRDDYQDDNATDDYLENEYTDDDYEDDNYQDGNVADDYSESDYEDDNYQDSNVADDYLESEYTDDDDLADEFLEEGNIREPKEKSYVEKAAMPEPKTKALEKGDVPPPFVKKNKNNRFV